MKQKILIVKDLQFALEKIVKPILKTPRALLSNRKYKNIGLSPREFFGLFLICLVGRFISKEDWSISSDPEGYDGVVVCRSGKREGEGFAVEQVYVPGFKQGDLTELVLSSIEDKCSKGKEYGKGRHLIVFCDKNGPLDHQLIKSKIATKTEFYSYWIIGKMDKDRWEYLILSPKTVTDPVMAYKITINDDFRSWKINLLGRL